MEFFIKKIFDENTRGDEIVHLQFQKFSRGEFKNRAMISAKNSKENFTINTTAEFANELVRAMAEKLGNKTAEITGVIVSTKNLKEIPEFSKLMAHVPVKQFMGIKQFQISQEMSGNQIIEILNLVPSSFIAFSFKTEDSELKIKPKAPKSAKPSTKSDEKPKIDFCKLKTSDKSLLKNLIFDKEVENFKKIEIIHDFIIIDIIIPEEFKNEKDFSLVRARALKKGKIIRNLDIDGKKIKKEIEFIA